MKRDDGFTLVEVLAALAVFSLAAIGLIQVTTQSLRTADILEGRFLARVVADNALSDAMVEADGLADGMISGTDVQLGREFGWVRRVVPAPVGSADTVQVSVAVTDAGTGQVLAEVSALRLRTP